MVASESKFASGCLNESIFNDAKVGLKDEIPVPRSIINESFKHKPNSQ